MARNTASTRDRLGALVRSVPDFPKPGILFRDITPVLRDAEGLRLSVESLASPFADAGIQAVAGIEARGFILGPAVALRLGIGFIPIRKEGKLPGAVSRQVYDLEYGSATIELHEDAIDVGDRILIVDDVLATGGTAGAAVRLVESGGGVVAGLSFLLELTALEGRRGLGEYRLEALLTY